MGGAIAMKINLLKSNFERELLNKLEELFFSTALASFIIEHVKSQSSSFSQLRENYNNDAVEIAHNNHRELNEHGSRERARGVNLTYI